MREDELAGSLAGEVGEGKRVSVGDGDAPGAEGKAVAQGSVLWKCPGRRPRIKPAEQQRNNEQRHRFAQQQRDKIAAEQFRRWRRFHFQLQEDVCARLFCQADFLDPAPTTTATSAMCP